MYNDLSNFVQRLSLNPLGLSPGDDDNSNPAKDEPPAPTSTLLARQAHVNFDEASVPGSDDVSDGAANSTFFQDLPLDIRRLILIQAFGNQTVHVDYDSAERESENQPAGAKSMSWGLFSRLYTGGGSWIGGGTKQPRWYGFVCNSALVSASLVRGRRRKRNSTYGKGRLSVASEKHQCLEEYRGLKGTAKERARIGALGWLRACRRASVLTRSSAQHDSLFRRRDIKNNEWESWRRRMASGPMID